RAPRVREGAPWQTIPVEPSLAMLPLPGGSAAGFQSEPWARAELARVELAPGTDGFFLFLLLAARFGGTGILELGLVAVSPDHAGGGPPELATQHLLGERIFDVALDRPLERPGPEGRVEALLDQEVLRLRAQIERDVVLLEPLPDLIQEDVDDLDHLLLAERMEDHHFVDAVQELGVEGPLDLVHDLRAHGLVVRFT